MENKNSQPFISVVIPNRNGARALGACLDAATTQNYPSFEVIVVDDASTDGSAEIAGGYPARLLSLPEHGGASRARNAGAKEAKGDALFFIDSDCVMPPDTLSKVTSAFLDHPGAVVGGTYSVEPHDPGFFNRFQAVYVNFSETKRRRPDYIATHAMLISREMFLGSGGFDEDFMPILEDVEFSHRMRDSGVRLLMRPEIEVRHVFGFTLTGSLMNAYRKTRHWVMYSMGRKDLLSDSGTASFELKINTAIWTVYAGLALAYLLTGHSVFIKDAAQFYIVNLVLNLRFLNAMAKAHGPAFLALGTLYYTLIYTLPVALGGIRGIIGYMRGEHR
jgi:GT2 family glycosyltransferase